MKPYLALNLLVLVSAGTAFAEPHWPAAAVQSDDWRLESSVDIGLDVLGYEPATVVSTGYADVPIDAQLIERQLAYASFRLGLYTSYFHFEARPYTQAPHGYFHMSGAGLELWLSFPVADWLRFGLHHHSSHNFADSTYGNGLELDGMFADVKLLDSRRFRLLGDQVRLRLQLIGYWMFYGYSSAYRLTPTTSLRSDGLVDEVWRGVLQGEAAHPLGQARLGLVVNGEKSGAPASMRLDVSLLWHVGWRFLGPVGEHLLVGPFYSYSRNFARLSEYGRDAHSAGLLLTVQFTDDPDINRPRP